MSQIRRKYTKEEKLEIIKLSLDKDQSIKELGERFELSAGTIYNWRNKYFKYEKNAFPGHGNKLETDQEREISRLKKELKEAKLERDILKKAVGIFSKNDKKFSNL
jgi:transposase